MTETATLFCVNHPRTETVLRCNRCERPMCRRCVELTPVGYRCKECISSHRASVGYYNATALDHVVAALVGLVVSVVAGAIMASIGGFFFVGLFAGPAGGALVSESVRAAVRRRRGELLWLVACAAIVVGGALGGLLSRGGLLSIGLWLYVVLAVSTAYARLRV